MMNENSEDWWMTEKSFELPEDEERELKSDDEEPNTLELGFSNENNFATEDGGQPIEDERKYVVSNPDDI